MKPLKGASMQKEMGVVSNLITDMTVKGATESELARAVKHSMVVIDSEKHGLNWKQSEIDNGIQQLRIKYQGKKMGGAATLISRSSGDAYVLDRTPRRYTDGGPIDKETGEKVYTLTNRGYNKTVTNKRTGETTEKWIPKMTKSSQMAETRDARTLSSGSAMEEVYATHANRLKALANRGRLSMISTPPLVYTPSAARAYKTEVSSLQGKLNMALRNKPLERQAQRLAHYEVQTKLKADPDLTESQKKKIRTGALSRARARIGTTNSRIDITPKEWEAIQAGAVSNKRLEDILLYTDDKLIKQYATPRQQTGLSSSKVAMAKAMAARGYTQAEIAEQLGVSTSTINNALK